MKPANELLADARKLLKEVFGYSEFRAGQQDILEAVFRGQDVLAIMPTGGGKSLCYQLPALLFPGITLVVSPLIALMKDQVDALQASGYPATFLNSSLDGAEMFRRLDDLEQGRYKLLYVAPERFANPDFRDRLQKLPVSLLAVDEAHCISMWGHDFRPAYTRLSAVRDMLDNVQTIALTATATPRVQSDIVKQLRMDAAQRFIVGFWRENLFLKVDRVQDRFEGVLKYVRETDGVGIIYAGTRKNVDKIAEALQVAKIPVAGYHAGLPDADRKRIQEAFINEKVRVIVATNAFGMGIDKPNVRFVLHFQMPGSVEAYYQEAGRAGRDGDKADCILFYSPEDRFLQEFFISMTNPPADLVHAVFQALRQTGDAENALVSWNAEEIATMLGGEVKGRQVEAALRFLVHLGYLAQMGRSPQQIAVRLHKDTPAATPEQAEKYLAPLHEFWPETGVWCPGTYGEIAELWSLPVREAVAALQSLQSAGLLDVAGPYPRWGYLILRRANRQHWQRLLEERRAEAMAKLEKMLHYTHSLQCRHAFILEYFGDETRKSRCENCDNCRRETITSEENTVLAQKVLSCVVRMHERYGVGLVAEVLAGSKTAKSARFANLSTYGLLSDMRLNDIKTLVRLLQAAGYLQTEGDRYPILKVTESGWQVLRGQEQASLPKQDFKPRPVELEARVDAQLFQELRRIRSSLARRRNLPPYAIFSDRSLREMATYFPTTDSQFLAIHGVGEAKLQSFGPAFLRCIRGYVGQQGKDEER